MREDGWQPRQGLCDLPLAAFGMVPFLTSILNTMLPMLGAAKHDATREVLCYGEQGPPGHAASVPSPVPLCGRHGSSRLQEGGRLQLRHCSLCLRRTWLSFPGVCFSLRGLSPAARGPALGPPPLTAS